MVELVSSFKLASATRTTRSSSMLRLATLPIARSRYVDNTPIRRCISTFNNNAELYVAAYKKKVMSHFQILRRLRLSAHEWTSASGSQFTSSRT